MVNLTLTQFKVRFKLVNYANKGFGKMAERMASCIIEKEYLITPFTSQPLHTIYSLASFHKFYPFIGDQFITQCFITFYKL